MEHKVSFEIEPSAMFGLPQEGVTVIGTRPDGTPQQIYSDAIHARTGVRSARGTLSQYRAFDERISEHLLLAGSVADVEDNMLCVHVSAESRNEALDAAVIVANRFASQLGVLAGRSVVATPVLIECDDGDSAPPTDRFVFFKTTVYDLAELRERLTVAAGAASLDDSRLASAERYFQHALWLMERQADVADPRDANAAMLVSSIFLNLWKAASVIVGDPTKDKDHQKRHRAIGLDDNYRETRIKPLKALRDDSDVAHYSLQGADLKQLAATIGEAVAVIRELILAHTRFLQESIDRT